MKKFIDIHIPISQCNLHCHYCYVGQTGERNSAVSPFRYSPGHIGNALSKERLGGECHFNMCGIGETLIPQETVEIAYELLKQGHYVMIVTNGTMTKRFQAFSDFPEDYRKRLGFKFSFHYLELMKRGLLDHFFKNIDFVRKTGMSFSLELMPSDELEPYIEDIKAICLERVGALCHVTIPRDEAQRDIVLLSKHSFKEFCKVWEGFDSPMFDFKKTLWEQKRKEFCYAGLWSGLLNVGNGMMNACYRSGIEQNIMDDISKPIDFVAVGEHCALPHCFNSHSLLGLGNIPCIGGCTYAEERDRIDIRDGSHWLQPEMSRFLSGHLYEENEQLSDREIRSNNTRRASYIRKFYTVKAITKVRKKLKRIQWIYKPYRYCWSAQNKIIKKKRKMALQKYGKELLNDIYCVFQESDIHICAMWGTLLGFIREGGFIPWDDDIDFAIIDNVNFSWDKFESLLKKIGLEKLREFVLDGKICEQSYIRNNVIVDFAIYSQAENHYVTGYSFIQIPGKEYHNGECEEHHIVIHKMPLDMKNIECKTIQEVKLLIPSNHEEVLEAQFGQSWRIPDPDFTGIEEKEMILPVTATYFQ